MGAASSNMSADPLATYSTLPLDDRDHVMSTASLDYRSGSSSINSLRAAALQSASQRAGASTSSQRGSSTDIAESRNMSVNTAIGVPLAKVDLGEKEEGEISEEEDENPQRPAHPPVRRPIYPSSTDAGPSRMIERRGSSPSKRSLPPIKPTYKQAITSSYRPANPSSFPAAQDPSSGPSDRRDVYATRGSGSPKRTRRADREQSPQKVSSAGSDISPDEARKYMDIIRKLLNDGLTPETLVKRGATPKFVTAVCEEIVEGTRRRKALWLGSTPKSIPSDSSIRAESVTMSSQPSTGSGDSEVEVLISTDRRMSLSSEGSAEFELIENPSPPLPRPPRLIPSSHWAPSPSRPQSISLPHGPAQHRPVPSKPVKIESYKPTLPANLPSKPTAVSRTLPAPIIRPVSSFIPSPKINSAGLPVKPIPTGPKLGVKRNKQQQRQQHRSKDAHLAEGPATLNYDDDGPPQAESTKTVSPIASKPNLPARPIISYDASLPTQESLSLPSTSVPLPVSKVLPKPTSTIAAKSRPPSTETQAEIDAKNAIIEIRRKALASMRLRRQHKEVPVEQDSISTPHTPEPVSGISTPVPTTAMERTIEQEVLDLEQEVLGLQQAVEQSPRESEPMDLDSPEEGEITPSSLPLPLPIVPQIVPVTSTSLPTWNRGVKRPNAEELDARPLSAPNTWIKRKPFGGGPQRPGRLLVNLDEGSDDDSDEESAKIDPTPFIFGLGLVQEKDEQIRLLKEKIAAKLREREAKKLRDEGFSPSPEITAATWKVEAAVSAERASAGSVDANTTSTIVPDQSVSIAQLVRDGTQTQSEPGEVLDLQTIAEGVKVQPCQTAVSNKQRLSRQPEDASDITRVEVIDLTAESPSPPPVDQVVRALHEATGPLDIEIDPAANGPSSGKMQPTSAGFTSYAPLLRRYPLLSATTATSQSFPQFSLKPPISAGIKTADYFTKLDRSLMSSIILTHRLGDDPHAVICPAEAGGGVCADPTCDGIHLDRGEPTLEDWIEYISQTIVTSIPNGQVDTARVRNAVSQALKSKAKGKGKASVGPSAELGPKVAMDQALETMLGKIGRAYQMS